ncbi:alcohol dehydrogenase superfamily protein [Tanacetum coccineum]
MGLWWWSSWSSSRGAVVVMMMMEVVVFAGGGGCGSRRGEKRRVAASGGGDRVDPVKGSTTHKEIGVPVDRGKKFEAKNRVVGVKAVGVVTAIGPGVNDLKVGDVVYHSSSVTGTYTKEQIVLADKATPLPPIDHLVVAFVMERINHSFLCQNLVQGKIYYA